MSDIIYQWNIQGLPEYAVSMDTRFNFLEGGRIVELTQPVTKSDAGIYQCSGVTGFGQKKVVFEVNIAGKQEELAYLFSSILKKTSFSAFTLNLVRNMVDREKVKGEIPSCQTTVSFALFLTHT